MHGRRCALRLPGQRWTRRLTGKPIVVVWAVDGSVAVFLSAVVCRGYSCIIAAILIDTCRPGCLVLIKGKVFSAWGKRVCWRRRTLLVTFATHHHGQDVQTSRLWARLACLGRRHNKHTVGAGIHIFKVRRLHCGISDMKQQRRIQARTYTSRYPPVEHDIGRTEDAGIWTRHWRHASSSRSGNGCCVTMQIESPEGIATSAAQQQQASKISVWPSRAPPGPRMACTSSVVAPCTAGFRCTSSSACMGAPGWRV